jgi:hypothetical protein
MLPTTNLLIDIVENEFLRGLLSALVIAIIGAIIKNVGEAIIYARSDISGYWFCEVIMDHKVHKADVYKIKHSNRTKKLHGKYRRVWSSDSMTDHTAGKCVGITHQDCIITLYWGSAVSDTHGCGLSFKDYSDTPDVNIYYKGKYFKQSGDNNLEVQSFDVQSYKAPRKSIFQKYIYTENDGWKIVFRWKNTFHSA